MTARFVRIPQFGLLVALLPVLAALSLIGPVNAAESHLEPTGYVITPRLNIRTGPYFTYSVVVVIDKGQGFTLLGRNTPSTWLQIKLPSGIVGWAKAAYLKTDFIVSSLPVTGDADVAAMSTGSALVITGRLNVRTAPDPFSRILAVVDKGATLTLVGRNTSGTWAQVKTSNGTVGWVKAAYLRPNIAVGALPVAAP
jgi:uncharacterized protein YgiM (DUF1202 family)